jgi:hypothetical protein
MSKNWFLTKVGREGESFQRDCGNSGCAKSEIDSLSLVKHFSRALNVVHETMAQGSMPLDRNSLCDFKILQSPQESEG